MCTYIYIRTFSLIHLMLFLWIAQKISSCPRHFCHSQTDKLCSILPLFYVDSNLSNLCVLLFGYLKELEKSKPRAHNAQNQHISRKKNTIRCMCVCVRTWEESRYRGFLILADFLSLSGISLKVCVFLLVVWGTNQFTLLKKSIYATNTHIKMKGIN